LGNKKKAILGDDSGIPEEVGHVTKSLLIVMWRVNNYWKLFPIFTEISIQKARIVAGLRCWKLWR